jgi:hypothetical protein
MVNRRIALTVSDLNADWVLPAPSAKTQCGLRRAFAHGGDPGRVAFFSDRQNSDT